MPGLFNRKNSDPLHPLCPQCKAQASAANKPWRSAPYPYRGIWTIDTRDHLMAHCPACSHEWTLHVSNTIQEFGRRSEGPFYPASSFFDLKPADLQLLEIAFDLGKDDEPTPNAWSYVQLMMGVDGWLSPTNSLIDTLRELAAVVEDGNDTPVFAYDFSVEPTYWHSPGEKIADTVIVKCLAGEQTCDRAWLLDRLKRLVATFEQTHNTAYATQFQALLTVGRQANKLRPSQGVQEESALWEQIGLGCCWGIGSLGIALWFTAMLNLTFLGFLLTFLVTVIAGIAISIYQSP